MRDSVENAVEELKRVDHSIFVSLKYTRTVDILVNILIRMVDCYEWLFIALLKYAKDHKMCDTIPTTPKERIILIKQIFHEQEIHDNIDLYLLLKAMMKSNHSRENEYRRHVAMRAVVAGREEVININIISSYYEILTSFFHTVDNLTRGTYVLGSGPQIALAGSTDEENPNNPYWTQVKLMKEEAEAEIIRDRQLRDRMRLEKQQKEFERIEKIKSNEKTQRAQVRADNAVEKKKRITKRKPKIIPKRVEKPNPYATKSVGKITPKGIASKPSTSTKSNTKTVNKSVSKSSSKNASKSSKSMGLKSKDSKSSTLKKYRR